jgi:tetratricopeptide (TPR) repeat protein
MYRNALKKDPKYGEAYYRAAVTELKMDSSAGMKVQAARDLHRAVELQPDNMDAYERLINIYLELFLQDPRRPKSYVTELKSLQDRLAKRSPNSYQVIRLSGYLALTDNKIKDAINYFQQANAMKPLQPDVVLILMQSMQSDGRFEEAEKLAYEVLKKDPRSIAMYDALFVTYLRTNRHADAERILKTKIENIPENDDNYVQLAAHYYSMRKPQEMNDTLNRLLADPKKFPNGYKKVGDFYLRIRDLDSAARIYREGAAKFPAQKADYQKALCEALANQGKYKEAQDLVAEILRADPNDNEAIGIRASLKLATGSK